MNAFSNGSSENMPSRLITATPSCTTSPRPGVRGDMFAGRSTRSVPERYGAKPCWPHVQLPSVTTSAPVGEQLVGDLGGDAASCRSVLAVDDAEVDRELAAQAGKPLVDRPTPGAPNTSATKRMRK